MNSVEQLERLIQRLPAIASDNETVETFWGRIDNAMELVWDCVKDDTERREVEARYQDLVAMAELLGLTQPRN